MVLVRIPRIPSPRARRPRLLPVPHRKGPQLSERLHAGERPGDLAGLGTMVAVHAFFPLHACDSSDRWAETSGIAPCCTSCYHRARLVRVCLRRCRRETLATLGIFWVTVRNTHGPNIPQSDQQLNMHGLQTCRTVHASWVFVA